MTTDVKLLPLPEHLVGWLTELGWQDRERAERAIRDYARANMEPLIAENERLRAEVEALRYSNGTNATCAGTFKAEAAAWRDVFVAERAMRYRAGGMKIEQARIHAETDAARMEAVAASQQQGGTQE